MNLKGRRILITAGPTREPIDPVRFISNRSSGKMGYALAAAAQAMGASVTLITGPVAITPPQNVRCLLIQTASELFECVQKEALQHEIFIAAAAVCDYQPVEVCAHKIKKVEDTLMLKLIKTPDSLKYVGNLNPKPFTVGFAAETEQVKEHAKLKLFDKNLDLIFANEVGPERGFDQDQNAVWALWPRGEHYFPMMDKSKLAMQLMELIGEQYEKARSN